MIMERKKLIHFVGIGGIGISALAKYYLKKGWEVSGCDLVSSEVTSQLKKMGVAIRIGAPDSACSIGAERIIYSPAVSLKNPELEIRNSSLEILSYPQALGELTKTHYTIAVSGTHGKSTTTAMLGLLLIKAGLNPTVIVGTKLKEFGNSNFRMGGRYLVIEADEHFASFLNYWPKIIVLTTVEADHLDYYKNLGNILRAFKKYILHLPQDGILVVNKDDKNIGKILHTLNSTTVKNRVYFSMLQKEAGRLRKLLKIPGEHNVADALAALTAARVLGVDDKISFASLSQYKGSWRRFELFNIKKPKPYTLVSDYGHHPTKVRVTVEGARSKWPRKKIWLVYQPHQYARTYYLFKDFVKVLASLAIEKLILADIFDVAGRENDSVRKKVSSEKLYKAIVKSNPPAGGRNKNMEVSYIPDSRPFTKIGEYLKKNIKGGEIVMIMGAGDIYNFTLRLTQGL